MTKKQKRIILDSSVWLSLILKNDSNYEEAIKILFKTNSDDILLLPSIVYYEVVTVLLRLNELNLLSKFLNLKLKVIYLSEKNFLLHAFRLKDYIKAKTHDFLILIYCLDYSVDMFESFDIKQRNNYFLILDYEKREKTETK